MFIRLEEICLNETIKIKPWLSRTFYVSLSVWSAATSSRKNSDDSQVSIPNTPGETIVSFASFPDSKFFHSVSIEQRNPRKLVEKSATTPEIPRHLDIGATEMLSYNFPLVYNKWEPSTHFQIPRYLKIILNFYHSLQFFTPTFWIFFLSSLSLQNLFQSNDNISYNLSL